MVPRLLVLLPLGVLVACQRDGADTKDSPPVDEGDTPGVWRLGPPAPSFGLYGVAADGDAVYVSNQHAPWITVADAATGEWVDALSLADAGAAAPAAPELARVDRTLYATALPDGLLLRWDLDTRDALPPLALDPAPTAMVGADGAVWVATADSFVARLDGEELVDRVDIDAVADRVAVGADAVAWIEGDRVGWASRTSDERWAVPVAGTLGDLAVVGDTVYVSEREAGDLVALRAREEVARVHVGADPGAVVWDVDQLLVVDRQGAALPSGGTYAGAPGVVVALDAALEERWRVDVERTPYFLAWDGARWWTAGEDSMRLAAFGRDGTPILRGPPLGLTLDSVAWSGETLLLPSHITDEVWVLGEDATAVDTCGWPLVAVPDPDGQVWVPCQMDGDVLRFDLDGDVATTDVAETFQPGCGGAVCTGRDLLLDAVWHAGQLWWSDPQRLAVRAWDGTILPLDVEAAQAPAVQHLDLASAEELYAFEPRDQRLYGLDSGGRLDLTGVADDFPIAATGPLRIGDVVVEGFVVTGALPGIAVAGGELTWVRADWDLLAIEDGVEIGRMSLHDLRVPPDVAPDGAPGPLRYSVGPDGALWVVNLVRGTVERREARSLAAIGTDEIRAVGRWATLPGLR